MLNAEDIEWRQLALTKAQHKDDEPILDGREVIYERLT